MTSQQVTEEHSHVTQQETSSFILPGSTVEKLGWHVYIATDTVGKCASFRHHVTYQRILTTTEIWISSLLRP